LAKFIVIEGLIGVGKTSLCRLVEKAWNARLVLEPCERNPFLSSFYEDPQRFAFPTQMFYLASRYMQQLELGQHHLFDEVIVADYLFAKDRLFAEVTLNQDEIDLYDRFAGLLKGGVAKPDFVVFLEAPISIILERIRRRAIGSEQVIQAEYLEQLKERYYRLWARFDACPIYVLDTSHLNYVDDPNDAEHVLSLIRGWLDEAPVPNAPRPFQSAQRNLF
jgi:deoxyadenosine/deoxycytidine kinase